jgi:triphosphoribosyl-dephospho-CoA synthase
MNILEKEIARCYEQACLLELRAIKPGNVGYHADGHDMTVDHFIKSAEVSSQAITRSAQGVGDRILNAVQATHDAVADNTNLGIILLAAPLVEAILSKQTTHNLRAHLSDTLEKLSVYDARQCYRAISIAAPGGMGEVKDEDLSNDPRVTLLEAMRLAQERDRIAFQYVNQYIDVFDYNLGVYHAYLKRWLSPEWAATAVFLSQLKRVPDTLIKRKYSLLKACGISDMIAPLVDQVLASRNPIIFESELLSLDSMLKKDGINPGTTADLTVATIFVAMLESISST